MEINEYLPKCGSWSKFYARKARKEKIKEIGLIAMTVVLLIIGSIV